MGNSFIENSMTPSQQCKAAGLKSLSELARISGVSEQTLINWHRSKPRLFYVVVAGAVAAKGSDGSDGADGGTVDRLDCNIQ